MEFDWQYQIDILNSQVINAVQNSDLNKLIAIKKYQVSSLFEQAISHKSEISKSVLSQLNNLKKIVTERIRELKKFSCSDGKKTIIYPYIRRKGISGNTDAVLDLWISIYHTLLILGFDEKASEKSFFVDYDNIFNIKIGKCCSLAECLGYVYTISSYVDDKLLHIEQINVQDKKLVAYLRSNKMHYTSQLNAKYANIKIALL